MINSRSVKLDIRKKNIFILAYISFILGLISISWLVYDYYAFELLKQRVDNVEEIMMNVYLGFIPFILFHLSIFIMLILLFYSSKMLSIRGLISFMLGLISFLWLIIDWAALDDYANEYLTGSTYSLEWLVLYIGFIPHTVFILSFYFIFFKSIIKLKNQNSVKPLIINENVFLTINVVGVFSGIIGLAVTSLLSLVDTPPETWKYFILPLCLVTTIPYAAIIFYRFIGLSKKTQPLDEKQKQDLHKAGNVTWLISVFCMLLIFILYYLNVPGFKGLIWFPYFLFTSMLVFSVSVIYFYKKI
jgi:hypothetical protein